MLAGKIAIVTGASSGLGRAIAIGFAAEGATVWLADITEQPLEGGETTAAVIEAAGGEAIFCRTDVSREADIAHLVQLAVAQHGRLDIMVNNAATFSGTGVADTSLDQWEQVMGVNLTGMFLGCRAAVRQMLTQAPVAEVRGRIINLGSQMGIVTAPRDTPYGVSKAGAIYLTRQIAADHGPDAIVCNCISPGKIVTGRPGVGMDPALLENARRRTPWPRLGRPQDIANAAVFLASDRASYITGANLVVDGGWLAG